jgi:hypothetical protein
VARGDGRGRFRESRALDGVDEHGNRRALRGDVSRAVLRPDHLRSAGEGAPAPTTTRGHRRRRSGARSWAAVRAGWGERGYLEELARQRAPEVADDDDFRDWFVWHMRRSLSPGAALTASRAAMELDVQDILAAVRVPTLVIRIPRVRDRATTPRRGFGEQSSPSCRFSAVSTRGPTTRLTRRRWP